MGPACPCCGAALQVGLRSWHLRCVACSYEGSSLSPRIVEQAGDIDEEAREHGLSPLRQTNFRLLSQRLGGLRHWADLKAGGGPRLLDVGCAHGWFLQANEQTFRTFGIEPDPIVAAATRKRGLPVREGFFPAALQQDERFDVIVFNDVLEHIPDINSTLAACHSHLGADGYVVVNAPSRTGFLYRLSKMMLRCGMGGAFDRLWQLGLPSPHVHYLDTPSMQRLAEKNGFKLESRMSLPSVTADGLYERIHCSNDISAMKAAFITAGMMLAIPFLKMLPSDIEVWFLRKH